MADAAEQLEKKSPHYFHAEAHALSGKLILPIEQDIKKQAFVKIEGPSDIVLLEGDHQKLRGQVPQQNYLSQHGKNFRLEGIVSYSAAHTQVSGHRSKKHPDRFVTLSTSVVEDLNLLNVVTADRVVAQISATHFPDQYSPEISFLGTHFENLRIARHRCEPFLNLGLAGERPEGKKALYVASGTSLMTAIQKQYARLEAWLEGLSDQMKAGMHSVTEGSLAKQYYGGAPNYGEITVEAAKAGEKDRATGDGKCEGITCSLVENIEIKELSAKDADGQEVKIPPPAKSFGHVIHIPDFGTIFLAELTVDHNSFHLTMVRAELGCMADGAVNAAAANVNGGSKGGGG